LQRFKKDLGEDVSIAQDISLQGFTMILIVSPLVKK
jgi:hypothetical protein